MCIRDRTCILVLPSLFGINPIGDVLETVLPRAFRVAFWLAGYHE